MISDEEEAADEDRRFREWAAEARSIPLIDVRGGFQATLHVRPMPGAERGDWTFDVIPFDPRLDHQCADCKDTWGIGLPSFAAAYADGLRCFRWLAQHYAQLRNIDLTTDRRAALPLDPLNDQVQYPPVAP